MAESSAIIVWIRRDLRLTDHAALSAAASSGRPVVPVFIHDQVVGGLASAPKWRLGLGVASLAERLAALGARLILRKGDALEVLRALVAETGADAVFWQRAYDPATQARDSAVKAALKQDGLDARSFPGHLLFEPWTVQTKTGGFYKVFTPFWRAVKDRDVGLVLPPPKALRPPAHWPASDELRAWRMGAAMQRGASVTVRYVCVGEQAAQARLGDFIDGPLADYAVARDCPGVPGTSGLSENLTYGEISPRMIWHAGLRAQHLGDAGADAFLRQVVWREFAYHLLHHTPHIESRNWRPEWDAFPWNCDEARPEVLAWKQGRTGIRFVDAAMRQMHVTGVMHNRARMNAASYLTKHLMSHWRIGQRFFEAHLVDWDPASNAMGWQWAAGSGPDAAPYFRVFNPDTQLAKFDRDGSYSRRWIAEGQGAPPETALHYYDAIPRHWGLTPRDAYPAPVVALDVGRARALAAYRGRGF